MSVTRPSLRTIARGLEPSPASCALENQFRPVLIFSNMLSGSCIMPFSRHNKPEVFIHYKIDLKL